MPNKTKAIVFGCQQIAVDFIDYLIARKDVEIPLVVTYELPLDTIYGYESVFKKAGDKGLHVINPRNINKLLVEEIREINPDIIFSIYYRRIFPKELLSIPRLGCVNIHPSKLPSYRGPVPTAWAIIHGEKDFGITIHYMDENIDTGDILVQKEYKIGDNETGFELYTRGMQLGAKLLEENFPKIIHNQLKPRRQVGIGSYYGKLSGRSIVNWRQNAEAIHSMVRVHAKPYNPAETMLFNKYVLINRVSVVKNEKYLLQGAGVIMDVLKGDKLIVSCADGCLLLEDYEIVPHLTAKERAVYLKIGNRFG